MKLVIPTAKRKDDDELFATLSQELPVGVCIMQDGKFCYVNSTFPIAIGYTVDELVGKDSLALVVPEDREMVNENTVKMLKGELRSPYQFRVTCKDGSVAWVMATVKSIQYRGKRATLGNYMEITERKLMDEAVKDSEEKYKELANSITDVFFAMDGNLRYTYWNKASEALTGIRVEDALGKSLREVFPERPWRTRAEEMYRKVLKTQQLQTFVNDYDVDGRHYILEITAYPCRNGISVFVKDITEQQQTKEARREAEAEKSALLEEAPVSIVHTDMKGKITYVNQRFESESGYGRAEVIGRNGFELDWFPPDTLEFLTQRMAARLEGSPAKHWETQFKCRDGRWIWIELEAKILRRAGVPVGFQVIATNITERKHAEDALRQSEERYRTILEEMEDSYFEVDLGGHLTFVNNSVCRDLGYSREELMGKSYKAFTVEDDIESVFRVFNEVYRTGIPNKGSPWRTVRKDGTHGFAETSVSLLRNDLGDIIGFRGVGRDITERKQTEQRLRQSKESYRALFDNSVTGTLVVDAATMKVMIGNQAAAKMFGFDYAEEGVGVNLLDFVPLEDRQKAHDLLKNELFERNSRRTFDLQALTKDGRRIWISATGARITQGDRLAGLLSFADITEHKLAEQRLRQSEENYRVLFDNSVIGTIVLDAETMKVVMANQAAAKIFDFDPVGQGIGLDPVDFIAPEDKQRVLEVIVKEVLEKDLRHTNEFRAVTKNGRQLWISATGARIMHEGRVAGLISFADITDQKLQSERLIMTDRLASLGELASGTAHELNNPLTSIIGFSQLLMERQVPDDIREDLRLINNEAQRAAIVTKNLLTFARRHAPMKEPNQINNIIEDVLRLRSYDHRAKNIEVENHFDPRLPEVMVDYFQMQQVFVNIIINAEYFMIDAHNRGTLTVTTKKQDDKVMVLFTDDGPGIPLENLGRIFDPFFTTKEAGKGTGLGLSICHGIVTEHGGQIYARSQLGKGATIVIELPVGGEFRS